MTMPSGQMIDPAQYAGEWALDASRSSVSFRSSSLWGLLKVKGHFAGLRGDATVDPTGTIRGRLIIDAATVDTGNQKRDTHLRSDDFFAVTKYPEIAFELNDVALGTDQHRLNGTLQVIGNRQPLDLTAQVADQEAGGLTLQVTTTVDRSRWGVTFRKNGMVNMNTALDITARFNRVG